MNFWKHIRKSQVKQKQDPILTGPDPDPEYLDYLKEIQAKNERKENGIKPKQFIIPQKKESGDYFSTSEDVVIDIKAEDEVIDTETEDEENSENSCIEEIFENKNIEDTFIEQSSEINKKQQIKTKEKK